MIGAVTTRRVAFITAPVLGISWRKRAQPPRRQQLALNDAQDTFGSGFRDQRVSEADSKNLIWPDWSVPLVTINNIVQASRLFVPEQTIETQALGFRDLLVWLL